MCGLVAIVSKSDAGFWKDDISMFQQLLFIDTFRGDDSTGVFLVNKLGNVDILKAAVPGPDFIREQKVQDLFEKAYRSGKILVGHNRKATKGTVNDDNAHPFWVDEKLVLVHNGTMIGDHKKHADVEVDSHAIAHVIAEHEDVEEAIQKITAAMALIWYDIPNKKLNILRNSQRPLAWAETQSAFILSSEPEMIDFITKRNAIKLIGEKPGPKLVPESTVYTFSLNDKGSTSFAKREIKMIKPYVSTKGNGMHLEDGDDEVEYYRCMYGVDDSWQKVVDNFTPVKPIAPVPLLSDEVIDAGNDWQKFSPPSPDDTCRLVSYKHWTHVKNDVYKTGSTIKVVVEDFEEHKGDPTLLWMTGKTIDGAQTHVAFTFSKRVFESIKTPDNDILFSVEVQIPRWMSNKQKQQPGLDGLLGNISLICCKPTLMITQQPQPMVQ